MGKYYISKHSIINYLATDKAFKNAQKSEWHIKVIENYLNLNFPDNKLGIVTRLERS